LKTAFSLPKADAASSADRFVPSTVFATVSCSAASSGSVFMPNLPPIAAIAVNCLAFKGNTFVRSSVLCRNWTICSLVKSAVFTTSSSCASNAAFSLTAPVTKPINPWPTRIVALAIALNCDVMIVADKTLWPSLRKLKAAPATGRLVKSCAERRTPSESSENIASALLAVADNAATTESEIVNVTLRVGPVAKLLGLTAESTFAFAAAMKDAGIRTEVAGSSLVRLFAEILKDAPKFARAAELDVAKFSASVEESARTGKGAELAILAFIKGVKGASTSSKDLDSKIRKLIGSSVRITPAIEALIGNVEKLEQELRISSEEVLSANRINEEFRRRMQGLGAQADLLRNAFNRLRLEMAESLFPVLKTIVKGLTSFVNAITDALGPAGVKILAFGLLIAGVAVIILGIVTIVASFIAALSALGVTIGAIVGIAGTVFTIFGAILGAIAGLIAIVVAVRKAWQTNFANIQDIVLGFVAVISEIFGFFRPFLVGMVKIIREQLVSAFESLKSSIVDLAPILKGAAIAVGTLLVAIIILAAAIAPIVAFAVAFVIKAVAIGIKAITLLFSTFFQFFFEIGRIITESFEVGFFEAISRGMSRFVDFLAEKWGEGFIFPLIKSFQRFADNVRNVLELLRLVEKQPGPLVAGRFTFEEVKDVPPEVLLRILEREEAAKAKPIPALARGGVVTGETLARLGEGGRPEVVAPLDSIEPLLAKALAKVQEAGARGVERIVIPITLELDGRTIASVVEEIAVEDLIRAGGEVPVIPRGVG